MKFKQIILFVIIAVINISYCQSQLLQNWKEIQTKIKGKIIYLYPNASNIQFDRMEVKDSTFSVSLKCNCKENSDFIFITFDTNGNFLQKYFRISINDLPDTILNYMKINYSKGYRYDFSVFKIISSKDGVFYKVGALPNDDGQPKSGSWIYFLKFNSSGKYISTEKVWQNI